MLEVVELVKSVKNFRDSKLVCGYATHVGLKKTNLTMEPSAKTLIKKRSRHSSLSYKIIKKRRNK